jgi:vacuolar-type H+-ATPase subunit E/Vma4
MEKQNIVTKIISDAELKALDATATANRRADQLKADATAECEAQRAEYLASVKRRGEEALERRKITARLDCNKLALSAKREVFDGVFEVALKKLCALPAGEYVALVDALLQKYGERGEEVVISSACAFAGEISALPVVSERGLKVSDTRGSFAGGIVLVGGGCDKNLSFEALIQSAKEQNQAEVAARLFG